MTLASGRRHTRRQVQGRSEGLVVVVQGQLVAAEQDRVDPA
jgi:hypothetical protein